jgi:hypothetical protein
MSGVCQLKEIRPPSKINVNCIASQTGIPSTFPPFQQRKNGVEISLSIYLVAEFPQNNVQILCINDSGEKIKQNGVKNV